MAVALYDEIAITHFTGTLSISCIQKHTRKTRIHATSTKNPIYYYQFSTSLPAGK